MQISLWEINWFLTGFAVGAVSRVPYILWYKRMDSPERIPLNSMVF